MKRMDDPCMPSGIILLICTVLVEALFYGFGAAIQNINIKRLEELSEAGNTKADRIKKLAEEPADYIDTLHSVSKTLCFLLGCISVRLLAEGAAELCFTYLGDTAARYETLFHAAVYAVVIWLCVILFLLFGVLIPKRIGMHYAEKLALSGASIITAVMFFLKPTVKLLHILEKGLLTVASKRSLLEETDVTEEEILSMVNEGHEQGVLMDSEAEMISNIMEYGDKEAKDIMTNRNNIHAFDASATLKEVTDQIMEEHFSRFPVYEQTLDHVIGIIHLKDVMRLQMNEKIKNLPIKSIRRLLRKPVFIPETKNVDSVLKMMQTTKTQMVIVIDEYGQTSGLLALEDILEEIVGNIQDEYDEEMKFILSVKQNEDTEEYVIEGQAPLEYLEDYLHIAFETDDYETLNGFMISHLDRIPEEGEKFSFEYEGCEFSILSVKNRMIDRVRVKMKKSAPEVEESTV